MASATRRGPTARSETGPRKGPGGTQPGQPGLGDCPGALSGEGRTDGTVRPRAGPRRSRGRSVRVGRPWAPGDHAERPRAGRSGSPRGGPRAPRPGPTRSLLCRPVASPGPPSAPARCPRPFRACRSGFAPGSLRPAPPTSAPPPAHTHPPTVAPLLLDSPRSLPPALPAGARDVWAAWARGAPLCLARALAEPSALEHQFPSPRLETVSNFTTVPVRQICDCGLGHSRPSPRLCTASAKCTAQPNPCTPDL